jgi:Dyp-type peroxidase family
VAERPVAPAKSRPGWKLKKPHDAMTQGLVVSGFSSLPTGRALFLEFAWTGAGGGSWLDTLQAIAPITDSDGRDPRAAALAFTWVGLQKMGLSKVALDSFAAPFREGMMQEDRLRRLGDRLKDKWLETVIDGGPQWSANTPQRDLIDGVADSQAGNNTATGHKEERISTPVTVHALLLLYTEDEASASAWQDEVAGALAPLGVKVAHTLPLDLRPDPENQHIAREHFGFADGISQPIPYDPDALVLSDGNPCTARDTWNGVPLGEILIGHVNGHHEVAPGPVAEPVAKAAAAGLLPHPQAEGLLDFGLDGSYMVVRELKQDVARFWASMTAAAERIRKRDPKHSAHVTADWLAERVIGRNRNGDLLCPAGFLSPDAYGDPDNDFGFHDRDLHGMGCPMGSHVRRGNPRDGLAVKPQDKQTLLDAANNHRILRRGRKFGPTIADRSTDDHADRGLLFICLNTDISRQFEFVQQTWMLNPNFAILYDETDPLLGPKGKMTIRDQPLRRIIDVETFVRMAGGDYFFLPSMPALRYLAAL